MNLAEKVMGIALVGLMALISWNLVTTINLQKELLTIQHEQKHLHEVIEKQLKKINKKLKNKKNK
tara:strand:+ start:30918 stop:31112 length:195 start_codon:yes stop_codon:yes gene_type:complete